MFFLILLSLVSVVLIVGICVVIISNQSLHFIPFVAFLVFLGIYLFGIVREIIKTKNYKNISIIFGLCIFLPFLFYSFNTHYIVFATSSTIALGYLITLTREIIKYEKSKGFLVLSSIIIFVLYFILNNLETIGIAIQKHYLPEGYFINFFKVNFTEGYFLIALFFLNIFLIILTFINNHLKNKSKPLK
jgi:hypothetical protein